MDPLEYLFRQRQQRYDIIDNITDRLAKIGEERRRKEFTQAIMEAVPEDRPVDYEVLTNLTNRFPDRDPLETWNALGGLSKIRTAGRVKNILNTIHSLEQERLAAGQDENAKASIAKKAQEFLAHTRSNDPAGLSEAMTIYKQYGPQTVQRDPDKDTVTLDWLGNEIGYKPGRKKDDTRTISRERYDQLVQDAGGDTRKGMAWYKIENDFPIGKQITSKITGEDGEVREIQKTVTGYDPETHKPIFDETDITAELASKREWREVNRSLEAQGYEPMSYAEYMEWKQSTQTDRLMGNAPKALPRVQKEPNTPAPSPKIRYYDPKSDTLK